MKNHRDYWNSYSPKNYKTVAFFLAIAALVIIVVIYSMQYKPEVSPQQPSQQQEPIPINGPFEITEPSATNGNLLVAVKDVKQKLATAGLGEATELFIAIKSIQVTAANQTLDNRSVVASDWTTVFEGDKTLDLLQFSDNIAIIAEKEIDVGNYTQVRVYISGANIKIDNPNFEIYNKTYPMYIPTNVLKVAKVFSVEAGRTTVLTLDFDVPKLVSRTSQGYTLGTPFKEIIDEIKVTQQFIELGAKPGNGIEV